MHTISRQSNVDGWLVRTGLLALWIGEMAVVLVFRAAVALVTWQGRIRERRQLASMDDRLLRDIGVSRSEVHAETIKPFWQG